MVLPSSLVDKKLCLQSNALRCTEEKKSVGEMSKAETVRESEGDEGMSPKERPFKGSLNLIQHRTNEETSPPAGRCGQVL